MFVNMENLVHDIVNHNLQNRTIALVENGSWAPTAGGLMRAEFSKLKNCTILDETVTIKSSLKEAQLESMDALAEAIVDSMPKHEAPAACTFISFIMAAVLGSLRRSFPYTMCQRFPDIVDVKFTARMEDELDEVESGKIQIGRASCRERV